MFDGAGFVRGVERKGRPLKGAKALVVGSGGVGSAIAASLAAAGISAIGLFDASSAAAGSLGERLREHFPRLKVETGSKDPEGYDIVVNATPLGMKEGDPLPIDVARIAPTSFVGEVVMKQEMTPFLRATKIILVDGEMFSWYGSRLTKAAPYFQNLVQQIRNR